MVKLGKSEIAKSKPKLNQITAFIINNDTRILILLIM